MPRIQRAPVVLLASVLIGCRAAPPTPPTSQPAPPPAIAAAPSADAIPPPREDGRLPPVVRPTRYALGLTIDPSKKTFSGSVHVGVTLSEPTRAIVMHGRGMTIRAATLTTARGKLSARARLRMAAFSKQEPEELVLVLEGEAPAGDAELDLEYEAPFASGLRGLYRVQEGGGSYAFTQFEPNDARRAFPCFDEPGYKTPFDVSITVPKGAIAVANAREQRRRDNPGGDLVTFEFEQSKPLPTYLVAFGVGPFDIFEGPKQPVEVRLVAAKGKAALGKLSVEAAAAHLDLLGKYFDRPYPYSKLDDVAVPNFGAGAMENAGLVTFREELLLLDPAHASTAARRAMAAVTAHELAHQWFGDLVTMQWWDDVWLNEAFASWMSDKIVDQWRPASRARIQAVGSKAQVMAEDSLATARKIRNPVRSTSEAEEAFDAITYVKGRAVLNMTEAWLGEDTFREGMRLYVKKHEWGNATASDLYAALSQASGQDVAKVMDSFTDQTGVPLVTASLDCNASSSPAVVLRQEEYRTLDRKGPSDKRWRIPVCVVYDAAGKLEKKCTLLEAAEGRIDLAVSGERSLRCPAFFYANAGETGYYRLRLDRTEIAKLASTAPGKLTDQERFGALSNAWAEVWSGDLAASTFLELLRGFKSDKSRLVWVQLVDSLIGTDRAVVSDGSRPAFAKLVRDLLGPTGHRLGWTPKKEESDDDRLLRETVLGALGGIGEDDWALSQAKRVTDRWLTDPLKTDADLARVALPLAARRGDAALFDRLRAALKSPKTPEVRVLALAGLSAFEDPTLIGRTLDLTLDGTIKTQDLRYLFLPLGARRATRDATYAWIEKHFDELMKSVPPALLGRFVRIVSSMCDAGRVRAAAAFFRSRLEKVEGTEKDMRQSLEEGLRCAALAEKEGSATSTWLAKAR